MRILVRLFAFGCLLGAVQGCSTFTEQPSYETVRQQAPFELRDYDSVIVAETQIEATLEEAGGEAFERLFGYISGENRVEQDIAMTSPVTQTAASEEIAMTAPVGQRRAEGGWVVSFVMPEAYTLETLPEPTDPEVTLRAVPERRVAVIEYSGTWSSERYQQHLARLTDWVEKEGLEADGQPIWARYNPPFTPWFLRHNEIMIPVKR
ncbi:heme-binding protein [Salicola sp. Rm-C-2C1-2]|uniref:SOUL family heme-binding protein n=1 Tax=Salicola sp. Rm-C-2C1-2 TaxID=3141321 RepID=UPI0032E3B9CB